MKYLTFSHSSLGPKYKDKNWKCQDCSDEWIIKNKHKWKAIAVADGHGSSDCFRSDVGSRLAIIAVKEICNTLFCKIKSTKEISFDTNNLEKLKFFLVNKWRLLVKEHWDSNPFENEHRYQTVSEKYKERYESASQDVVEKYLYNAYGTTLLIAIIIDDKILVLQIGDGTCVVLNQDGTFSTPIPEDSDNYLNVTSSLCEENSHKKIRHTIINCTKEDFPVAIFLSTDGLDDCYPVFENSTHLYNFYITILENIITKKYKNTIKEIKTELLPGMTQKGSQDDISLAFLLCNNKKLLQGSLKNNKGEILWKKKS